MRLRNNLCSVHQIVVDPGQILAKAILHISKLLLIFGSVLLLNVTASGLTITSNCTPFPVTFAGGNGGTQVTCPAFGVAGATLNSVTLNYFADYQFGSNPGPNTVNTSFTPVGPAGVTGRRRLL